jgi:hypothetical protein
VNRPFPEWLVKLRSSGAAFEANLRDALIRHGAALEPGFGRGAAAEFRVMKDA